MFPSKKYQFWNTQPVPRIDETPEENDRIEPDKTPDQVKPEPYSLPEGFVWDTLELDNDAILKELYTLLNENYVEDEDRMFRFDYSPQFLRWALKPPGWQKDWHCGVRVSKSGKLVGFIGATPAKIKVSGGGKCHSVKMVEINFLCVHKKLRTKRMAPVLIREITRRVNVQGIFQAIFTAGVVIPKPVAKCRYYHRSINPKKLTDVKFSSLTRNMTMKRALRLYSLPENIRLEGFKEMTKDHTDQVYDMLTAYLDRFDLAPLYTLEEFEHWFLPQEDVINSYVVERDGKVLAFTSFYTLPSTVISHPTYDSIKAAYSFYNCATEPISLVDLMRDSLIMAKKMDYDVFNALDLMENKKFLEELKFGSGDGDLQYYLYNWKCPNFRPDQVSYISSLLYFMHSDYPKIEKILTSVFVTQTYLHLLPVIGCLHIRLDWYCNNEKLDHFNR